MKKPHLVLAVLVAPALVSCDKPVVPHEDVKGRGIVAGPGITEVRVLSQNWSDAQARQYYTLSQGSQMMPYDWFLHLEQDDSQTLFRDNALMLKLGYIPRVPDKVGNEDGLPVGFAKNDTFVGLTCAACHTGQINFQGKSWIIDGGPTMADAQTMMRKLEASLNATLQDPAKFERFAKAVKSDGSATAKDLLRGRMKAVLAERSGYNARNFPAVNTPGFGPGRLDAFDAIFNEVAVRFAQVKDAKTQCDAPVSYPFLWDTPQHDRVQWNGSVENKDVAGVHVGALGRNIGEVLGVFADVDTTREEAPLRGYPSSAQITKLNTLEDTVHELWSPEWPPELGALKPDLVNRGEALFSQYCARCHEPMKDRKDPARTVKAIMGAVGTDESMARNAATRTSSSGIFKGRLVMVDSIFPHILGENEPVALLLSHLGQRVILGARAGNFEGLQAFGFDVLAEIGQGNDAVGVLLNEVQIDGGKLNAKVKAINPLKGPQKRTLNATAPPTELPPELTPDFALTPGAGLNFNLRFTERAAQPPKLQYKARPLNGIWATAPYLHNGSVLNLDELLKPVGERLKTFKVGSREFDPVSVGFKDEGDFHFDTAQPGNANAGHDDYRLNESDPPKIFTKDERAELVEYMKKL